jgi:hypothetical protein
VSDENGGKFFMTQFTNPLDNIKIASPCAADWNAMIGNNRQRYCGECKLNVYNLSGMSRTEAENLLLQSEGRVCVRYFRRSDGTVLTEDCPVGWQAVKMRMSRFWTATASLLFSVFGSIGLTAYLTQPDQEKNTIGAIAVSVNKIKTVEIKEEPIPEMGAIPYDYNKYVEGKVSNIDEVKGRILKENKR